MKLPFLQTLLLLLFFLFACAASAQVVVEQDEEFDAPTDTAEFYKKLYKYSKDRKILFFVYKTVFNPPVRQKPKKKAKPVRTGVTAKKYKGKIIREIRITPFEPFGTSLNDTARRPHSLIQKGGNAAHVLTHRSTIRNLLIFKKGSAADPLKIMESERLLRSTGYIRDARIMVHTIKGNPDSVDVEVWTQDYWSIRPNLTVTTSKVRYRVTENNFIGLGHRLDVRVTDQLNESRPLVLDANYRVPTIGNTYISPEVYYGNSSENNIRGFRVNRPFYSPLTRVAGGLDILSVAETDSLQPQGDTNYYEYSFRSFVTDGWIGNSWKLMKGSTDEERSTRLVTALRYARTRYPLLNIQDENLKENFSSVDLYLASISLSSRKYLKDRYIFKFGEYEDVPDGRKLSFTTGYEKSSIEDRYYLAVDGAVGTYLYNWGYFYLSLGYGSFVNHKKFSQGVVNASVIYFTPLHQFGRWRYRQFTTANFTYGLDRKYGETLYLNTNNGLPGYKETYPRGTSRLSVSTQIQLYSPFEFLGFRFAPILFAGVGLVGDYNASPFKSRLYQSYGIGVLIKNELLVLNTFQVILAWYPVLPEAGSDFRFNPVKLTQSRFPDFDISKPSIAPYY